MAVAYNFRKGIDSLTWQWMAPYLTGSSFNGSSSTYDGVRYIYWAIQTSQSGGVLGVTNLNRYDTWTNAWQFLTSLSATNSGVDLEYDSARNVIYVVLGGTTGWVVFNLNATSVTIANNVCAPWVTTTIAPVLPALANAGASLTMPSDVNVPTQIDTGTADALGQTTTQITGTVLPGTYGPGMVGLQVRVTSGTQNGAIRTISAVPAQNVLTLSSALTGALATGDTFVVELQAATAIAGSTTTTLTSPTTNTWTVNAYSFMDVTITAGTGVGQRRRIASNTANVLTLAAAVTGNPRTGPWTTTPDATSVFRIVPSSDFMYYQQGGNTTNLYRIDVVQTTGAAWSATLALAPGGISGGGNTVFPAAYAPYQILALRGAGTSNVYLYNIGLNAWTTVNVFAGQETFNIGASAAMVTGKRKLIVQKEASNKVYTIDLLSGMLEPAGTLPYAPPGAYEGKRLRVVITPDGAQILYVLRAGGSEFFRVPLEAY